MTRRSELIDALRQVDGVSEAEIVDDASGVGTLRLALVPGADEVAVAMEVNGILREGFGLGVDAGRVQVVEETWPSVVESPAATVPPAVPEPAVSEQPAPEPAVSEPVVEPLPAQVVEPPPFVEQPFIPPAFLSEPAPPAPTRVLSAVPPPAPEGLVPAAEVLLPPSDEAPPATDGPSFAPRQPAPAAPTVPSVHTTRVAQAGLTGGGRLSIRRLQLVSSGTGISTAVTLGLGLETFVGQADAESAVESVQHAVAVATMRAVESVAGPGLHLDIERVEVSPLGAEWVALTVVLLTEGDRTDRLTGASVVREDVRQAVIRASLDAVNRRVEDVLRRRSS